MGVLLNVPLQEICPSEHFLRKDSIQYALEQRLKEKAVVPPFVQMQNNRYYLIDGHNRLVINHLFEDSTVAVYVASSEKDFISEHFNGWQIFDVRNSNKTLEKNFSATIAKSQQLTEVYRINSIKSLVDDYIEGGITAWVNEDLSFLKSLDATLREFNMLQRQKIYNLS